MPRIINNHVFNQPVSQSGKLLATYKTILMSYQKPMSKVARLTVSGSLCFTVKVTTTNSRREIGIR